MTVTMFLRLRTRSSFVVLVTGTPESVNAVRVLQSDASCALDVQLGVSFVVSNELTSSDNSSSVSLTETLVEAAHTDLQKQLPSLRSLHPQEQVNQ